MIREQDIRRMTKDGLQKLQNKKLLYKYINLTDGLEHIIKKNTLKFNNPDIFNDPFDCNERLINVSLSDLDIQNVSNYLESNYQLTDQIRQMFKERANDPIFYKQSLTRQKSMYRVSCFSEKCDEVLMWSHYADKHAGICIGFDLEIMNEDYALYPVNYISEIKPIDGMLYVLDVLYYWLTTKSIRWSYEKEIRAINKNGKNVIKFEKKAIKEILFGCRVKEEIIEMVVNQMKSLEYSEVTYSRMDIDSETFLLKKLPL